LLTEEEARQWDLVWMEWETLGNGECEWDVDIRPSTTWVQIQIQLQYEYQ